MQVYKGIAALTDFHRVKLLDQLRNIQESIQDIDAEYVHLIDNQPLSAAEESQLQSLLIYGLPYKGLRGGKLLLVTPRIGTISPWSSKATDIAKNSGLRNIHRIERGIAYYVRSKQSFAIESVANVLYDRMTENLFETIADAASLFINAAPSPLQIIDILRGGKDALRAANVTLGLALTNDEVDYLTQAYMQLKRNPTDAELMMFAQVNSEHCRHKIFNADWTIDGKLQPKSLFKMIRNTYEQNSNDILSAYSDNAAVIKGSQAGRFFADPTSGIYTYHKEPIHTVIKVETHNHPTAIAPHPGAATGVGGEIRDEGATGRGAKPKMGLSGFTVSNLCIPGALRPWEIHYGRPARIASALSIMIHAPIGAAAYANEFGRPNLTGYFRTYEQQLGDTVWGYHKPIMLAGGLGNIRHYHVQKQHLQPGDQIIVLGGPAMLIGLGGGAASSMQTGTSSADLDFASVQRANAEIERRVQEVIDRCWGLGENNPIISIHDVGAGGLSNALPELVHDSHLGAVFDIRKVPSAETGLSPLELWCNEAQERYVLGISPKRLMEFASICERERCPFAVVGEATNEPRLIVTDALFDNRVVDLPMATLFGKPPKMTRTIISTTENMSPLQLSNVNIKEAAKRILQLPAVSSKKFLITIGDRNVGGLVVRDQMIGPWQVPVSDVAVAAAAFNTKVGEAMAIGERAPLAIINAPASARMAIGEAITNIAAADVAKLSDIKLSANWMAASGYGREDEKLFYAVKAVGEEFCPALGLTIPVGKDSLSMRTVWKEDTKTSAVTAPVSLVISAFSPVRNVLRTLTPQLVTGPRTSLILIDLGQGGHPLGGSALAQVYNQVGDTAPDADPGVLANFFTALQELKDANKVLAYHDRSDGGIFVTLCEMAFAGHCGLEINLESLGYDTMELLFTEELGVVIQVLEVDEHAVIDTLQKHLGKRAYRIGKPSHSQNILIQCGSKKLYESSRAELESWWSDTSYQIQKLRDNPTCADQEYQAIRDDNNPGLSPVAIIPRKKRYLTQKPKVAIFREQGVNGHIEMAAAFDKAGFTCVDVHLNDILHDLVALEDFVGLAACGGFSYGDVLGAGGGWAKTILAHQQLRAKFRNFFERPDTFSLGVCNGCQMLSILRQLIPGANSWPQFVQNNSMQFEARLVLTQINDTPSVFLRGMAGSYLPIPVAHGEGRAYFDSERQANQALHDQLVPMQYVDNYHHITECYPANPNGSPEGIAALTTPDGRAMIMMPHPERAFLTRQLSWHPHDWKNDSPWLHLFHNARSWVDKNHI